MKGAPRREPVSGSYDPQIAHGLMFHRFHHEGDLPSGQGSITEHDFEAILLFVGMSNILAPQEWMYKVRTGALSREDVCITFDDGLMSQYRVALPILEKYKLKAFWFVYSSVFEGNLDRNEIYNRFSVRYFDTFGEYVKEFFSRCDREVLDELRGTAYRRFAEKLKAHAPFYREDDVAYRFIRNKVMTRAEFEQTSNAMMAARGLSVDELARDLWLNDEHLRTLSRAGHSIGLHSYDHPFELARLSATEQEEQFARNRDHIAKVTGTAIRSMAHPLNSYDETTLAVLERLGIECGFRANTASPPGKPPNASRLELAREDGINLLAACRGRSQVSQRTKK